MELSIEELKKMKAALREQWSSRDDREAFDLWLRVHNELMQRKTPKN